MDEILGRVDRRPVHHFHAARNDAGPDDVGDALPALLARGKADQQRARRLRLLQDAHGDLGDDAEEALRAGHDAEQVVAFRIEMPAAEAHDLAIHQHHLDAEHVVGRQAVFQAVHAAGIFRDIAADRAGDLRGRIGGVIEALLLDGGRNAEIGDARLGDDDAVGKIDLENAVEAAHDEQHCIFQRQCAARQRGAGAARHDADVAFVAELQDPRHLPDSLGQHDDQRQLPVGGQPVAFEGPHLVDGIDDALARHDGAQAGDDLVAPPHRFGIGLRHGQAGHRIPRTVQLVKRFYLLIANSANLETVPINGPGPEAHNAAIRAPAAPCGRATRPRPAQPARTPR